MSKVRRQGQSEADRQAGFEWDADVIAWLMKVPRGQRSAAVRDAIRAVTSPQQAANLEAIRAVVAQELATALTRQSPRQVAEPASVEDDSAEARYGSKLNKMMSGLSRRKDSP